MKKYTSVLITLSIMLIVLPVLEAINPKAISAASLRALPFNQPVTVPDTENQSKIDSLKAVLLENPNYLQYTEYKMLKRKNPSATKPGNNYDYYDDYGLKPYGPSPLSQEFSGGFFGPNNQFAGEGIDIITGARAVDESMQIGSIGSDRDNPINFSNRRQLETALKLYYSDKSKYPDILEEMAPNYIGIIPQGFTYKNLGSTYQLTSGTTAIDGLIKISDVPVLEIKTHPWESMVKTKPKIPEMFSLVPADDTIIYFKDMDKFTQLEQTITAIGKPLDSIYNLSNSIEVKNKIFKRLGIKDIKELRKFIDEVGLVAYDMDAYPNTDYALILKLKSSLLNNFISEFITAPKDRQAQVGDYFVIATDKSFLDSIKNAKTGSSMAKEKDLAYAMSVLETNYDGFAFLSEKFIQKLTSPSYRINARRRNTVLNALETWQYTVFAYKDITGSWPTTLEQIASEGYIEKSSVAHLADYSVDAEGIVKHKDWGSIYDVTPVSQVPITTVSEREKNLYVSFKDGYQQFWREFIDPVGVAITIGDQIRFHTIILPLIDKSEYNWIKDIAGNEGIAFDFLKTPDRVPSLQLVMKLNVDDSVYAYYKSMGKYTDEGYTKCTDDYYKNMDWNNPDRKTIDETCQFKELPKAEAVAKIKNQIAKALDWQEKTQVLDFIDNEFTIAGGENLIFNIEDLSSFDMYVAMEMKDQEMAKKFIDKLFVWVGKEFSGGQPKKVGYGLFSLEAFKPLKNTYNNVDFYMVPLGGMTNIYYVILNNRLYLTISQNTINKIIDGGSKKGTKEAVSWPTHMQRLFDYLGDNMNLAFVADNTKLQTWLKGAIKDQWTSYPGATSVKNIQSYYTEALALAKTIDPNDNGINSSVKYYRYAPKQWFDAQIGVESGRAFFESAGQKYFFDDIDIGSSFNYGSRSDSANKTPLSDITKTFNVDKTLEDWQKLKDLGIGFNLTKEGLDIRIAFNNVASEKIDKRVGKSSAYAKKTNWPLYGGIAVLAAVFGAAGWFFLRRKKQILPLESISEIPTPSPHTGMVTPEETPLQNQTKDPDTQ